jgi:hypothetical protein
MAVVVLGSWLFSSLLSLLWTSLLSFAVLLRFVCLFVDPSVVSCLWFLCSSPLAALSFSACNLLAYRVVSVFCLKISILNRLLQSTALLLSHMSTMFRLNLVLSE